ncbi:hypothetical protein [Sphingobium sp. Z007]|uniref:hypothetical protein n=1 Tax=Sphingobium sp. Z007 TaxID=627495 RepID=UPI000B49B596|nr:hypothetical protein [Sphingobium sp. Z007]
MTPWGEALIAKYGAIVMGWAIGTAAKYGLMLGEGRRVTLKVLMIDVLLMGMVVLLARWVIARLGLNPSDAATAAALIGLASDRIVRMVRVWFLRRVDAELRDHVKGEIRQAAQIELSADRAIQDIATGKRPIGGE